MATKKPTKRSVTVKVDCCDNMHYISSLKQLLSEYNYIRGQVPLDIEDKDIWLDSECTESRYGGHEHTTTVMYQRSETDEEFAERVAKEKELAKAEKKKRDEVERKEFERLSKKFAKSE